MNPRSLVQSALVGTIVAAVAVAVTFLIADAASGPLMATDPSGVDAEAPLAGAIIFTVVGGLIGALLALATRKLASGPKVFAGICLVGLVVFGAYSLNQATTLSTGIWLNVMHVVAAIPIVGMLLRWMQAPALK